MKELLAKYVLVSGGVLSGTGKGCVVSSLGMILKEIGFKITIIKIDPYLNIDSGTMSPYEHGEVFVLQDGGEVDLDFGHYERAIGENMETMNSITTGKVYNSVIQKERRGEYLGKTVQVVPHIVNEVIDRIFQVVRRTSADFCIIELGGTIGDIESMPFIEALRQLQLRVGPSNFVSLHLSLVPLLFGEQKTKPTQSSVRTLRSLGISPDVIVCRCEVELSKETKDKVALFCLAGRERSRNVLSCHNVSVVEEVPLILLQQNIHLLVLEKVGLKKSSSKLKNDEKKSYLEDWRKMVQLSKRLKEGGGEMNVSIGLVGKYTKLEDCYHSVYKSLCHAGLECNVLVNIVTIDSSNLLKNEEEREKVLSMVDGILVPGGFGTRGVEGKLMACRYARENDVPFLGICLGFQCAVIEFCRNVLGLEGSNSEELDEKAPHKVVIHMPDCSSTIKGGTMRLGEKKSVLKEEFRKNDSWSRISHYYGRPEFILERHRHRYEVNLKYRKDMENKGLRFIATDVSGKRLEILEVKGHSYYVGVQYHPEFVSRPGNPNPCFVGLIDTMKRKKIEKLKRKKKKKSTSKKELE